jgi:hypothetical protein
MGRLKDFGHLTSNGLKLHPIERGLLKVAREPPVMSGPDLSQLRLNECLLGMQNASD